MTTAADRINAKATDEARNGLRTIISLDAFLALCGDERAARWRQFDDAAKFQLCALAFERKGIDWMPSDVEAAIAAWNAKYAPKPTELAVEAALERMAGENADHARTARREGEKSDAAYFQRAATSYTNALIEYQRGVRPTRLDSGAWLLPSRRPGEAPHIVRMDDDHVCDCKAGASMHWPIALIIGIEISQEDMERFDEPSDDRPGPIISFERRLHETKQIVGAMQVQQLGRRLAAARQHLYSEAA